MNSLGDGSKVAAVEEDDRAEAKVALAIVLMVAMVMVAVAVKVTIAGNGGLVSSFSEYYSASSLAFTVVSDA